MSAAIDMEDVNDGVVQSTARQFSTFSIANRTYGIDVMQVQEVTKDLRMTPVPLAPPFVKGLINLRGQIATAIDLRKLFNVSGDEPEESMNVVCMIEGVLLSFLVDKIGDVLELEDESFEASPSTVPSDVSRFMEGVYKVPGSILSVLDVNKILSVIQKNQ